jgi:hypothetical protein
VNGINDWRGLDMYLSINNVSRMDRSDSCCKEPVMVMSKEERGQQNACVLVCVCVCVCVCVFLSM